MGNENSKLKGLVVDKNAVEANDFWTLYNAECLQDVVDLKEGRIELFSVFEGETIVNFGQLWTKSPIERAVKNLMIYRHPFLLKYVTTWDKGGQKYLATERVRPLDMVLAKQNDIQICLGLRTILCSLIFLVEKANGRHLNICTSSIYVTDNGSWRLAGFEFVWKSKDVNKTLIDLAKNHRYVTAIDPSEIQETNFDYIEQYAFATLCEDILSKCNSKETPFVQEFIDFCAQHLKHKSAQMRPKLSAILLHPYFNHEFVLIHSFLFELPLKSIEEKQEFFTGLIGRLCYFNEEIVAAQLAATLLSRMVLVDATAQLCVTPYVLKTKTDYSGALFSNQTYIKHLMPHILKMFRLRDAQIRLILLEYFMDYIRLLSKDEILEHILAHLQVGMNDTNEVLVAKTMRCLADLIPILGSNTVLGGTRSRIFADGRPQAAVSESTPHWVEPRSITPITHMGNTVDYMVSGSPLPDTLELSDSFISIPIVENNIQLEMQPRPRPDGSEDGDNSIIKPDGILIQNVINTSDTPDDTLLIAVTEISSNKDSNNTGNINAESANAEVVNEDDEEIWSDWEAENNAGDIKVNKEFMVPNMSGDTSPSTAAGTLLSQTSLTDSYITTQSNASSSLSSMRPNKIIQDDLNSFDIQVQSSLLSSHQNSIDFDYFKDMEPVIETNKKSLIADTYTTTSSLSLNISNDVVIDSNRFAAVTDSNIDAESLISTKGDGWDDDDDVDWNTNA